MNRFTSAVLMCTLMVSSAHAINLAKSPSFSHSSPISRPVVVNRSVTVVRPVTVIHSAPVVVHHYHGPTLTDHLVTAAVVGGTVAVVHNAMSQPQQVQVVQNSQPMVFTPQNPNDHIVMCHVVNSNMCNYNNGWFNTAMTPQAFIQQSGYHNIVSQSVSFQNNSQYYILEVN